MNCKLLRFKEYFERSCFYSHQADRARGHSSQDWSSSGHFTNMVSGKKAVFLYVCPQTIGLLSRLKGTHDKLGEYGGVLFSSLEISLYDFFLPSCKCQTINLGIYDSEFSLI